MFKTLEEITLLTRKMIIQALMQMQSQFMMMEQTISSENRMDEKSKLAKNQPKCMFITVLGDNIKVL